MANKALFETETCGRCGGGGRYGPTSVEAGRCFGCAGRGTKLTKRGAAAQEFYRSLFPIKTVADLKVGDIFRSSVSDRWATVSAISEIREYGTSAVGGVTTTHQGVDVEHSPVPGAFGAYTRSGFPLCSTVTIRPSQEEVIRFQVLALEYQASLGKRGQVTKATKKILDTIAGA